MTLLVIHGHFYQPPRENPWTGLVEREPSAAPFHDWNERVHAECYRPNAFARIADRYGRVERILDNYAHVSFDFGPTLLSWIERHDPVTYARIVQADRDSAGRRGGHGNAIAHGYNHAILPLCNDRDRRTQIRWGLIDFRHRFGREPEALWLPETACNDATLDALIDEGLRYVILAPHQAGRVRPLGGGAWRDVSDGTVDPGVAYLRRHGDGSDRSIAVLFYDGPIARAVSFEGALASSQALVNRLLQAPGGPDRLVHVATDGESYGHHTRFGERALAYALAAEVGARGFTVTNYGQYLDEHPPRMEVEILAGPGGEGTAWSCAHGVGRWYRDCGCQTGGPEGWNQAWRGPLRLALDHLRDQAAAAYEEAAGALLRDPWEARDAYHEIVLDRGRRDDWLDGRAMRPLADGERARALALLELERDTQLMYTSCGWFFTEVSGIETVQVLRYAGRALDRMEDLGLGSPRARFLEILAEARSNLAEMGTGADVFHRFVAPARVTAHQVAAHLAISSLVADDGDSGEIASYRFRRTRYRQERHGRLTLSTGRLQLEHLPTGQQLDLARASLHLGGIDFYCVLHPWEGEILFDEAAERLWSRFRTASLPVLLRLAQESFGPEEYGLDAVLDEGRRRITEMAFGDLVEQLAGDYARLYQQNERVIEMLEEIGFEIPSELKSVAEFTLGRRLEEAIREAHGSRQPAAWDRAVAIAGKVARSGYRIDPGGSRRMVEDVVVDAVEAAVAEATPEMVRLAVDLLAVIAKLRLDPSLDRAQEIVYERLMRPPWPPALRELGRALRLAPLLFDRPAPSPRKPPSSRQGKRTAARR